MATSARPKLRAGIVGGGIGSMIGIVHRRAAEHTGLAEIIAGAMSADPDKAKKSAEAWGLNRSYASFEQMAEAEAALPDGIEVAIITTPNHLHYPAAKAFLERGIHVICDKPLTANLEEAQKLVQIVEKSGLVFALTHNYTGYPAVRRARQMVQQGEIGTIKKVLVEYLQGWLLQPLERTGQKQALWRTDPAQSGIAGTVADVGTHAANLLEFTSDLKITAVCADVSTVVEGRALDDDANVLLRLENGSKGILVCSQIAAGEANGLTLRLYGDKAGLEWRIAEADKLILKLPDQAPQILAIASELASSESESNSPAEGLVAALEAFATIYHAALSDIQHAKDGQPRQGGYPTVYDGWRGMQFVTSVIKSSQQSGGWLNL